MKQNIEGSTSAIMHTCRCVGNDIAAHTTAAEPTLQLFLKYRWVIGRVMASPVNQANTTESFLQAPADELFEQLAGIENGQTVQIAMSFDGKSPGAQRIEPFLAFRTRCSFDIFTA